MANPIKMTRAQFLAAGGKLDDEPVRMTRAEFAAAGGQLEGPPETSLGEQVRTGVEQGLNTATFGLYRKSAGEVWPFGRDIDAREERNPNAALAGNVAGFFTPGPALLARGARGVAGAAGLGVSGTRALAGGLEGSFYGLSAAVNEDYIGDPRMTAEHVAAGTLGSTLTGALVNTAFGKFGDVSKSALIKAFGGKGVSTALGEMAENSVMKAITNASDMSKDSLRGRVGEVGRFAIDEGFIKGAPSMATAAERAGVRTKKAWKDIEAALTTADDAALHRGGAAPFNPVKAGQRMQKTVDALDDNPAMKDTRKKLQDIVNDFRAPELAAQAEARAQQLALSGDVKGAAAAAAEAAELLKRPTPTSFAKAWQTSSDLLKKAGHAEPDGLLKTQHKLMRGELQQDIFDQASAWMPELGEGLKKANRDYANARQFGKLATKQADKVGRGFNATDLLAGGAGIFHGGVLGLAAPIASRAFRERGGFIAASAMDALAKSGALPKIANAFSALMKGRLATPGFGGAFRAMLETAAAEGSMQLLEAHMSMAGNPEYMASVGLEHEDPANASSYVDRAHRLAQVSNGVDAAGAEIDKRIEGVLGDVPGDYVRAKRAPSREEFEGLKAKLKMLTGDAGMMSKSLADLSPTTSAMAQLSVAQGADYLLAKAPKNPTEELPIALQRPWSPGKGDLREWFRRVEAVADPMSVLEDMQKGIVSQAAVEALQAVYPRLYRDFQERMQTRLSAWDKPLNRKQKERISQLIGDLDDPAVTQLIQAAHLRSIPPKAGAPDGREKLDVERSLQTQAQRLEGK